MMRFARRQYLIGSVVALGSVIAAACDREAAPPPADTAPPPVRRAPVTTLPTPRPGSVPIHVLFGPYEGLVYSEIPFTNYTSDWKVIAPQQELYRTMVFPMFQDRHPDHHVIFETNHDPLPVVQAAHAAGHAPDLFLADDRRGRAVVRQGLAERLDGRVRQWSDHADFVRPALAAGQYDRQQWGLPLFTQVYTLYYNQALLRALGLLRLPTTWEDLLAAADQSTKVEGHHVVRQGVNGPGPQWFMWLLQSTGTTLYEGGSGRLWWGSGGDSAVLAVPVPRGTSLGCRAAPEHNDAKWSGALRLHQVPLGDWPGGPCLAAGAAAEDTRGGPPAPVEGVGTF